MLAIQIPVNIYLLGGMVFFAALLGFSFRSVQLNSFKKKIGELEKEMLTNHAEILELQKEKVALDQKLKETSPIPVIPITASTEEKKPEKAPDVAIRKKMLAQQSAEKHS
jgi:hypothetical protein